MELVRLYFSEISQYDSFSEATLYSLVLDVEGNQQKIVVMLSQQEVLFFLNALTLEENSSYDMLIAFGKKMNFDIQRVIIYDFTEGIFKTKLIGLQNGLPYSVEVYTIDALGVARRFDIPIFISKTVVKEAGISVDAFGDSEEDDWEEEENDWEEEKPNPQEPHSVWKKYLTEELKEILAEALEREDYQTAIQIRDEITRRETL